MHYFPISGGIPGIAGNTGNAGRVPGGSFELIIIMGFLTCGPENDLQFSYNFDSHGRINLKVENACFACFQIFDFHGRIYLKNETRIFTKVHQIFGPPPGAPKSSPVGSKTPLGVQRVLQRVQNSSTRGLEDTDSIY